jgi:DNA gyrase subunit A
MVITRNGVVSRQRVDEIRTIGRATQGVRLVNLDEGDAVMDVARLVVDDEEELNALAEGIEEGEGTAEGESASEPELEGGDEEE